MTIVQWQRRTGIVRLISEWRGMKGGGAKQTQDHHPGDQCPCPKELSLWNLMNAHFMDPKRDVFPKLGTPEANGVPFKYKYIYIYIYICIIKGHADAAES